MEIKESKKAKQIITITVCLIIAVVSGIYNHMQLGEGKSIKEFFIYEETGTDYQPKGSQR